MSEAAEPAATASARYSAGAIVLHWLIASAILFQFLLGWRMEQAKGLLKFDIFQLHKSVGVTILLLSLARLAWRLTHRPPPLPADMPRWERLLAEITHVGLYVIMIGMPLTGWLAVSASPLNIETLLYGTIPWPHVPGVAGLPAATKASVHTLAENGHHTLAFGLVILFLMHVAGALKHQFAPGDTPVLPRMAPGAGRGNGRLAVIAVALVAVAAAAWYIKPPSRRAASAPAEAQAPAANAAEDVADAAGNAMAGAALVEAANAAANAAAEVEDAALKDPVPWAVQAGSSLTFKTTWEAAPINGQFGKWDADILFSPDALDRSKVTVTIDTISVSTGDEQRDEVLPSGDWFGVDQHPKATFTATKFTKTGEGRYRADGQVSLKGVTKAASLPFRLTIKGDTATMSGVTTLDRTTFGIGQGEFGATDQIPAAVTVQVNLKAKRK